MAISKTQRVFFGILLVVGTAIALALSLNPPALPLPPSVTAAMPKPTSPIKQDQQTSYPISPTSTPEKTRTPITIPTSTPKIDGNGWYIYQDSKAGYSFSYPVGTRLVVDGKGYVYLWFSSLGLPGHFGMEFEYRKNPEKRTAIEIAKQIYVETSQQAAPEDFEAFIQAQNILMGGKPAVKVKIPSIVSDYTILIPKGDHLLIINLEHDAVISSAPPDVLKLIDQILATLRLID